MKRIGKTPVFGIDKDETGLFVSQVEFTPACEEYEQLNTQGEISGIVLYKHRIEVSLTGEVPFTEDGESTAFTVGASLELANKPTAAMWGGTEPTATTTVIKPSAVTMSREAAREVTVSAVIYPFGDAA